MTEEKKVQEQPETVRPLNEKETEQVAGGSVLCLRGAVAVDMEMAVPEIQCAEVGIAIKLAHEDK